MTHPSVTIHITPESVPSTPSWMGEVAAFAQVLTHTGILKKIQDQVRFARARFGQYDLIDFVVVLIGYMVSGEPTLLAFYERLAPWASPFMALFGRKQLPHRSTLSRFLAALDQTSVEALRSLFQHDLLARHPFASAFRLVRPDGKTVDGGRCGRDPTSRPPTCAAATGVAARPSSPFRGCLRAGLSGAQTGRSSAHPHGHAPSAYASVSGHGWWARQWGLSRRTAAGYPGEHQLCHKACLFSRFCAASSRWPLWRCRSAHRCPGCWPWDDCQKS